MVQDEHDAFGHELLDHFDGKQTFEIIERDDGFFNVSPGAELYFSVYEDWLEMDKRAMDYVRGRVLDIGCGAGRHALYLQGIGFDVLGIDYSSRAIEVCRRRGLLKAEVVPITKVSSSLGTFDTILMMGNNFGLVANVKRARWLLGKFAAMTSDDGRIIAQTVDVRQTDVPEHLAYHEWNRARGRLPGQIRCRVRYKKYVTDWIDLLMVSEAELREILSGTKWKITKTIRDDHGRYTAVIDKV
jgi:2-polyprenyl-3-methyl-5-hydroxy-6-metoxy-1,4-benzoquinol methylase